MFTVFFESFEPKVYGDGARWKVIEGAALEVTQQGGAKVLYSPGFWQSVEADARNTPPPLVDTAD
jgi:hypothetical protein